MITGKKVDPHGILMWVYLCLQAKYSPLVRRPIHAALATSFASLSFHTNNVFRATAGCASTSALQGQSDEKIGFHTVRQRPAGVVKFLSLWYSPYVQKLF